MSGVDAVLEIDTAACAASVLAWRRGADWFGATHRALAVTGGVLELDGGLDVASEMVAEVARQLRLVADLLERAVRAAAAVGFDLHGDGLHGDDAPARLLDAHRALARSLRDTRGLRPVDLPDPAPAHDGWSRAHFGDVPLWGPAGPQATDVHQGHLGDCSLLSVLAAVAAADPGLIRRSIVDHGDGTYTVTVDGEAVTVDDEFEVGTDGVPLYARGPDVTQPVALWPLLFEKAAAIAHGGAYADVSSKDPEWAHDLFGGTDEMSISQWLWRDPSDREVLATLDDVLGDGRIVTATSGDAFGHGGDHAWTVVATGMSAAGTPTVTVRNPWGFTGFDVRDDEVVNDSGEAITGAAPDEVVLDDDAGTVTIPLDVFTEQFDELDYLTAWD